MAARGSTRIQTAKFVRKSSNHGKQFIADPLDNGDKIDAFIVDFSKAFYFVPDGPQLKLYNQRGL